MSISSHTRRRTKQDLIASSMATLDHELYRIRRQEQYFAFRVLQQPLSLVRALLSQDVDAMTPGQCDELARCFQEVQQSIRHAIATFEAPDLACGARPYQILLRLWPFHRVLVEVQVQVKNVRGLCEHGRLAIDLTGSYWQLRDSLKAIIRDYWEVLSLLNVEDSSRPTQVDSYVHHLALHQTILML